MAAAGRVSTWIQSPFGGGGGALGTSVTTQTANYTAASGDATIECDASVSGAFTVTIPTTGVATGKIYIVIKIDGGSNIVTVQPATGTVNGRSAINLFDGGDYTSWQWDGTTWRIVGGFEYTGGLRTTRTVLDDANPGNLQLFAAGSGFALTEGSNCKMGTATANGTTAVVVANTAVTANSRIYLTAQNPNAGTPGALYVSAITAATSFAFKSTNAADASTVAWLIIEHT